MLSLDKFDGMRLSPGKTRCICHTENTISILRDANSDGTCFYK